MLMDRQGSGGRVCRASGLLSSGLLFIVGEIAEHEFVTIEELNNLNLKPDDSRPLCHLQC